jgi:phosphoserine phosphatase RsbU/P
MSSRDLSSIPLFASLPEEEIRHLEATLSASEFPSGEVLLSEGKTDDIFYILLEGRAEVVKALGLPEERHLGISEAGSFLGELSLFTRHGYHTASVRSLTPLRLLQMSRAELNALLHRQPHLAYELIQLLRNRLEQTDNIIILDLKEKNQRLRQAYDDLKAAQALIVEKERLEKELEIAKQIQGSILPKNLPAIPGYDFGALMIPARAVGGDFYSFILLGRDQLGIVVGDVSDKGVPAALFMALTYSLMRAEAVRTNSPVQAFHNVNNHLLQMNAAGMFVTLVYGILDLPSGDFHYARAGHPSPYLVDASGRVIETQLSLGQMLGIFNDPPVDEQHIAIPYEGTLLLYSDGVTETMDSQGSQFGLTALDRSIAANYKRPAQEICAHLWQDVHAYGENQPQQDDFTTVVIKRLMDY